MYFEKNIVFCRLFKDNALTLMGILLGFSITVITILTTGNSRNLQAIQNRMVGFKIGGKEATLFDLLLINFTYSVVIEVLLIIIFLLSPIVTATIEISAMAKAIVFSFLSGSVVHVLLLTLRNLTNFYFILLRKENGK